MIDIYIDDIKLKLPFGYDGDKNKLAVESGENKALLIFDDDVLFQLYVLTKNRCEMKGLTPIYNTERGTHGKQTTNCSFGRKEYKVKEQENEKQ